MTAVSAATAVTAVAEARSADQFDLDKPEFERIGVDDVVRDAALARIGLALLELHLAGAIGLFQPELSGGQRNYDIVMRMDVVSGLGAWLEAPFSHGDPCVLNLHVRGSFQDLVLQVAVSSPAYYFGALAVCQRTALSGAPLLYRQWNSTRCSRARSPVSSSQLVFMLEPGGRPRGFRDGSRADSGKPWLEFDVAIERQD
jgi:hypothetical protein